MEGTGTGRTIESLPKAHLHLHFTGSMRPSTLKDLAAKHGIRLPESLREQHLLRLTPDERGWFRFQRLYDAARNCVRDADDMRRIVLEAAQDDAREGSGWLEMQVDPTSYAPHVGGLTNALEIVLDAAREASRTTACSVGSSSPRAGSGTRSTPAPWPGSRPVTPATVRATSSASG